MNADVMGLGLLPSAGSLKAPEALTDGPLLAAVKAAAAPTAYKRTPLSIIILEEFPYARPLSMTAYTCEPYKSNRYRRSKLLVIMAGMMNFPPMRDTPTESQDKMVEDVERGCYNVAIRKCTEENITRSWKDRRFRVMYQGIVSEVAGALDCENTSYLMRAIFSGRYSPSNIASLPESELCKNDSIRNLISTRYNTKIEIRTTSLYECPTCSKKKCWFEEVQLRSGDEGKDTHLICCYCGYDWISRL